MIECVSLVKLCKDINELLAEPWEHGKQKPHVDQFLCFPNPDMFFLTLTCLWGVLLVPGPHKLGSKIGRFSLNDTVCGKLCCKAKVQYGLKPLWFSV